MTAADSPKAHLAAIAALEGMGPARLRALLASTPPEEIWALFAAGDAQRLASGPHNGATSTAAVDVEDQSLPVRPVLTSKMIQGWERQVRSTPHTPAAMAERLDALGLEVLTGDGLPAVLAADHDPPGVLFTSGSCTEANRARVAIVGTRRASDYGLRMARSLGRDLVAAGVQVVSGLALGIDAAAHAGALDVVGAWTPVLAVIGAGHHRPCPSLNRGLARAVAASGVILSEVPPGIPSAPWRYPVRNRLIAGLADVVVVVESASRGGSMSTVAEALVRDRVVMAVPGSVGRRTAEGCHDLLREGAEICTGSADVLAALGLLGCSLEPDRRAGGSAEHEDAGPEYGDRDGGATGSGPDVGRSHAGDAATLPGAATVLELLADGPRSMDSLLAASGLRLAELSSVLVSLESGSLISTDAGCVSRMR